MSTGSPAVTPLACGALTVDKSIFVAGSRGVPVEAPSIVYLIEAEQIVLVDTSFGSVEAMAETHPEFNCRRSADQTLEAALGRHGYETETIDMVVLTHLDWDHCDGLELFESAEILVQREELAYAFAPYPMHAERYDARATGRNPAWLHVDVTPIDGETEICNGVTAFPTPGHTVGHQSVAVETDEGTAVAAGDAIPTFENLPATDDDDLVRGLAMNDFDWWHSAHEVIDRGDRILPGHEWGIVSAGPNGTG